MGRMQRRMLGCAAALITGVFATGMAWAIPSCPTVGNITSCCNADQAGTIYTLGADLTRSNANDCIQISAPNVFFNMNSHSITGPLPAAAGVGIHVLSTAPNAIVLGGGVVEDFTTGFQSDAANTFEGIVLAEFNTRGTVFNGPGALGFEPVGISNLNNGIILTSAASGSYMLVPVSESNGKHGIVLNGTTGVTMAGPVAFQNAGYGLWLKGASFNSITEGGDLEGNTIAGAYVGCHATGPSNAACAIPPSNGNSFLGDFQSLVVGSCPGGNQHNQGIGIAIDSGNSKNHVAGVETNSTTSGTCTHPGDISADGFDGNPGAACAGDFWFSNSFTIPPNHAPTANHPFCMR
jgi:hypothetical protein